METKERIEKQIEELKEGKKQLTKETEIQRQEGWISALEWVLEGGCQ